mgnify:CR=1 FL=1
MNKEITGSIYGINGPVVSIKGRTAFKMGEMVYVGADRLVGDYYNVMGLPVCHLGEVLRKIAPQLMI